jgi:GNAT superfamily N-acetyltransferase
MEVRLFEPKDTESVADVLHEMSRYYNGEDASTREAVRKNLVGNILGEDSDVRVVVAALEGRVVGVAMISILYPARKERGQLFMKELFVASDFRSHGVGRKLMAWIAHYAVAKNCMRFDWTVDAKNTKALAFYAEIGATHVQDKLYFRFSGAELDALASGAGLDRDG